MEKVVELRTGNELGGCCRSRVRTDEGLNLD